MLTLTKEEAGAIYDIIDMLSGNNPENVFAWNGTDDPTDVTTAACAKLYGYLGRRVPPSCAAIVPTKEE